MREDDFTCPACGAEFTVREWLDEEERSEGPERDARHEAADVDVTCPNCGAKVVESAAAEPE